MNRLETSTRLDSPANSTVDFTYNVPQSPQRMMIAEKLNQTGFTTNDLRVTGEITNFAAMNKTAITNFAAM